MPDEELEKVKIGLPPDGTALDRVQFPSQMEVSEEVESEEFKVDNQMDHQGVKATRDRSESGA